METKKLVISDEKFIRRMEEDSLDPNKNNCSSFGRVGDSLNIKTKAGCAENNEWAGVEIEDEENFVNKNDPRNRRMTTVGGYNWEENGFHVTRHP